MLVLFETPAGYALFKLLDKSKIAEVQDLAKDFETVESASKIVKLKAFQKFDDTNKALAAATSLVEGELDKNLKKFLKSEALGDKLAVSDTKLGGLISQKLDIKCVYDDAVLELMRGIRLQAEHLIGGGLTDTDRLAMKLGLSHSLCRHKLKFSPDKVDTMIVQAIALLDELDKELNTYAMRVREWFGWHFPEMGKIVADNIMYAKSVLKMSTREHAKHTDFSDILPEEVEKEVKEAAEVSMGTEIATDDVFNIKELSEQVISLSEYRASLFEYLKNRMQAIAPNLTVMVGELVGARLIAHAGSLINLAKHPASTVQILGAEKALFRALKTKHETPKYGLIYHASLVGQAAPKFKGKISRVLAAKTALSVRTDALGEVDGVTIGLEAREKVERRLRELEGGQVKQLSGNGKSKTTQQKYSKPANTKSYNEAADVATATPTPTPAPAVDGEANGEKKKKKKDKKEEPADETPAPAEEEKSEKKKKKRKAEEETADETPAPAAEEEKSEKKKKKKQKREEEETAAEAEAEEPAKKKKKKDKKEQ